MWLKNGIYIFPFLANLANIRDKKKLCLIVKQHVLTDATIYNIHHRESIAKQGKVKLLFFPFGIKSGFHCILCPRL